MLSSEKHTLGVYSPIESHESRKTEYVSHEILISPLIRNFVLSSKKYTYFMGSEIQHGVMKA
jgi:hypothetical protein